jgi:hypothetical protein
MMDDKSVDQRDERDGDRDARTEPRGFIRAIRAILGSLPSVRASIPKSLISKKDLLQVVDFHESFR